jgi:hypothetical protein
VRLLLIGLVTVLVIGVALTVFYFSLATFFHVHTQALDAVQRAENAKKNAADANATGKKRKACAG